MSDEEDYPGKELVKSAMEKLTPEELDSLQYTIHDKTLEKVSDWIIKDLDRIDNLRRSENVIYCRVLWLLVMENEVPLKVDEVESEKIKYMRKLGFSISELARMFRRSKSTIHAHIVGSITDQEDREIRLESFEARDSR